MRPLNLSFENLSTRCQRYLKVKGRWRGRHLPRGFLRSRDECERPLGKLGSMVSGFGQQAEGPLGRCRRRGCMVASYRQDEKKERNCRAQQQHRRRQCLVYKKYSRIGNTITLATHGSTASQFAWMTRQLRQQRWRRLLRSARVARQQAMQGELQHVMPLSKIRGRIGTLLHRCTIY